LNSTPGELDRVTAAFLSLRGKDVELEDLLRRNDPKKA
jgi:hypothetical protein